MEKEANWIRKSLDHSSQQYMLLIWWVILDIPGIWWWDFAKKETMHTIRGSLWFLSILGEAIHKWALWNPWWVIQGQPSFDRSSLRRNSIEEYDPFLIRWTIVEDLFFFIISPILLLSNSLLFFPSRHIFPQSSYTEVLMINSCIPVSPAS